MDFKAAQHAEVLSFSPDFSIKGSQGILSSVSLETEDKSEASDLKKYKFVMRRKNSVLTDLRTMYLQTDKVTSIFYLECRQNASIIL